MDKLRVNCDLLAQRRFETLFEIEKVQYAPCMYQDKPQLPQEGWQNWHKDMLLRGRDAHFWFAFECTTPADRPHKSI